MGFKKTFKNKKIIHSLDTPEKLLLLNELYFY